MTRTATIVLIWLVAVVGVTVIGLLASSTPAPPVSTTPAAPTEDAPEVLTSAGGTVEIVSASPAQGYRRHDEGAATPPGAASRGG